MSDDLLNHEGLMTAASCADTLGQRAAKTALAQLERITELERERERAMLITGLNFEVAELNLDRAHAAEARVAELERERDQLQAYRRATADAGKLLARAAELERENARLRGEWDRHHEKLRTEVARAAELERERDAERGRFTLDREDFNRDIRKVEARAAELKKTLRFAAMSYCAENERLREAYRQAEARAAELEQALDAATQGRRWDDEEIQRLEQALRFIRDASGSWHGPSHDGGHEKALRVVNERASQAVAGRDTQ